MKELKVSIQNSGQNYVVLDLFSHIPHTKLEIAIQELSILRNPDGTITLRPSEKTRSAFLCLNCRAVEYHDNGNGHMYPLCSTCASTAEIFNRYFQLDAQNAEYEVKPEYCKKIDSGKGVDVRC